MLLSCTRPGVFRSFRLSFLLINTIFLICMTASSAVDAADFSFIDATAEFFGLARMTPMASTAAPVPAPHKSLINGRSSENDISPALREMEPVMRRSQNQGIGGDGNLSVVTTGVLPHDDVNAGAAQLVNVGNRGLEIADKATGITLLRRIDIATLWSGMGGACESGGSSDAIAVYDREANRWVISQFATSTGSKQATEECFAVSTTSDAAGAYNRYSFHLGGNFVSRPNL